MCYCAQVSFLRIDISLPEMSVFLQSAAAFIFFFICLKVPGRGGKIKGVARLLVIFFYFLAVDAHLK